MVRVWSDETVNEIIEMRRKGASAKQIALHFNTTRSAISGLIGRAKKKFGLEVVEDKRPQAKLKGIPKTKRKSPVKGVPEISKAVAIVRLPAPVPNGEFVYVQRARIQQEPNPQKESRIMAIERAKERIRIRLIRDKKPVKLVDLEPHHCRYPLGEPKDSDFKFCGENKKEGSSYCTEHAIITSRFYEEHWRSTAEPLLNEAELKRYA
jgi:GcrA cell cycle regulator